MNRDPGSFRDPEAHVFTTSNRIFRGISRDKADWFRSFLQSPFFRERAGAYIVNTQEISPDDALAAGIPVETVKAYGMWVEHEPLPFISYPYEWSFDTLKAAACLTLKLLVDALDNGYTLKDASAYNVQFIHFKPVFMDVPSFCEYQEGDPWLGYKQFCEHFLAPLCLTAFSGIDFNQWFRGRLDGLDIMEVSAALPAGSYFRPQVLMHIHLHAWAMRKMESISDGNQQRKSREIPSKNLRALAISLSDFITVLRRKRTSYWQRYEQQQVYDEVSQADKARVVRNFVKTNKLQTLLDLGCNTGRYCEVALKAGAEQVIGVDFDCGAVDIASREAQRQNWPAQFLYFDIANPSPNQGWGLTERTALEKRLGQRDGLFCFALLHHLIIGRNIPMEELIDWVCGLAGRGLVEFIPKTDPMVQGLLRDREDIFRDYTRGNFERILSNLCAQVIPHTLQSTDRIIYEYAR